FLIGSEGDRRKRGALVIDSTTGATIMPYTNTLDAAFLTKDKLLLMFNGEEEVPKFTFAIYSIERQDVLGRFRLPIKEANSGEFFTRPPSTYGDKCLSTQVKRFLTDESLDILPVELYLNDMPPNPCFFVLSVTKLLRAMERLRESNPDRLTFEWDEWGPDITRFLPFQRMSPPSSRPTFGSRMAVFYTHESEEPLLSNRKIAILDFNPRPIKRRKVEETRAENIVIVDYETEWKGPQDDPVIKSRLPYRILRKDWLADGDDCHLEANTMILRR
ncbi:1750_t:CDS:2, partial [Acaulospora colombiana]